MANKLIAFAAVLSCFAMPGYAVAQAAPAAPPVSAAQAKPGAVPVEVFSLKQSPSAAVTESKRNIDNLQTLKSRIAVAEAKAKLAAAERGVHGAKSDAMQPVKTLPKVISVMGQMNNLSAQIVFAGGIIRNIKKGDQIGPMSVATVSMHEVILSDTTGTVMSLPFATHLSVDEAIKESLTQQNINPMVGFAAPEKMSKFDGPLPIVKN